MTEHSINNDAFRVNASKDNDNQHFIKSRDMQFRYDSGFFLNNINLNISKDEVTFLIGENGSGKSTLSKLLSGIYKPLSGDVFIDNTNTKQLKLSDIGKKIGYMWQNVDLQIFCITVWDEILFKHRIEKKLSPEIENKAELLLDRFKLSHLKHSNTFTISKGEKQRLAIATMMLTGAEYFFMDEPTVGLDENCKNVLVDLINELKKSGIGLFIISHDDSFISKSADRIIKLDKGKVIFDENAR